MNSALFSAFTVTSPELGTVIRLVLHLDPDSRQDTVTRNHCGHDGKDGDEQPRKPPMGDLPLLVVAGNHTDRHQPRASDDESDDGPKVIHFFTSFQEMSLVTPIRQPNVEQGLANWCKETGAILIAI